MVPVVFIENYKFDGFYDLDDHQAFAGTANLLAKRLGLDTLYFRMHGAPPPVSGKSFVFAMVAMLYNLPKNLAYTGNFYVSYSLEGVEFEQKIAEKTI